MASCKKTEDAAPVAETYDDYSGLKVGSYRIYNTYQIDENGKESLIPNYLDSICITGDRVISGNKYYEESLFTNGNFQYKRYFRDSLHYLVDAYGQIYYSSTDFQNIIKSDYEVYMDTFCKWEFFMVDKGKFNTVPAGTFNTITSRYKIYWYPMENGTYPIRNADKIYAKGIGLISDIIYSTYDKNSYEERRLIRYGEN